MSEGAVSFGHVFLSSQIHQRTVMWWMIVRPKYSRSMKTVMNDECVKMFVITTMDK